MLIRVDPDKLDAALRQFNADYGLEDSAYAIDGKTLRGAIDDEGNKVHVLSAVGHCTATTHVQKKVGKLPAGDEVKQTNEIGMVIPMLEEIKADLSGKTFTVDALLTQRKLAKYLGERGAFYVFTVKGNQPNLLADLELLFRDRGEPDFREGPDLEHGRIEERMDLHRTQRLSRLSRRRSGFRCAMSSSKKLASRKWSMGSQTTLPRPQPLPKCLHRGHWTVENSSHYVLELGRGPSANPHRSRPRERLTATPFRHWASQARLRRFRYPAPPKKSSASPACPPQIDTRLFGADSLRCPAWSSRTKSSAVFAATSPGCKG